MKPNSKQSPKYKWKKNPEYFYPKHEPMSEELEQLYYAEINNRKELESKLSNSIYWANKEMKGRERMRKLYAEKLIENKELQKEVEELKEGILGVLSIIPNDATPLVHSIRYRAEELLKTKEG